MTLVSPVRLVKIETHYRMTPSAASGFSTMKVCIVGHEARDAVSDTFS